MGAHGDQRREISSEALVYQSSVWGGSRKEGWEVAPVGGTLKEALISLRGFHGAEDHVERSHR